MSVRTQGSTSRYVAAGFFFFLALAASSSQASGQVTTGYLEVCKTSDVANPVSGSFNFTITSGATTLIRSVPVGACSGPLQLPSGQATITEAAVTSVGVNSITAIGLTDPTQRLVRSDLGAQTAVVTIVAGNISTETVATFRNFARPTGVLEVCKDAAPGTSFPAGTTFNFTISGVAKVFSVPVGACTGPVTVPAGSVTITEVARPDASLVSVSTLPAGRLVSTNLGAQSAVVTIVGGDVSTETVARFVNRPVTGQLKICKIAGTQINVGTNFTIAANGVSYTVPAGPAAEGGFCVLDGTFPVGTQVTVQETIPNNVTVGAITVAPANRGGAPNLTNGSIVATIGTGFTEVTFTNQERQQPPLGQLKICKIAGPGVVVGTNFTISATPVGGATQTYTVPAGPASEGGFCVLDGTFPVGTAVTVQETIPSNARPTAVTVTPSGRGGTPNLTNGSVVATIGTGFTEVAFTNTAVGTLQICKIAGTNVAVGTGFTFALTPAPIGASYSLTVSAGAGPTGTCSAPLSYLVGTPVSVTETAIPANTTVSPSATQTATITTTPGRLTFTNNRVIPQTTFQVCKIAGSGVAIGRNFTFTTSGYVPAATLTVAAGTTAAPGCSSPIAVPVGTAVTVVETVPTGITALPSASQTVTVSTPTRITFTDRLTVIQACSPGFFKNHSAFMVSGVTLANLGFTASTGISGLTLQQALSNGGGGVNQLGRAAAAAFLNLVASGASVATAEAEISALVTQALAGNQAAINQLNSRINDSYCTLSGRADPK